MTPATKRSAVLVMIGLWCLVSSPATSGSDTAAPTPLTLFAHDQPPANSSVLSLRITITSATLQPGDVPLLRNPVTLDLAALAADRTFLASAAVRPGIYTGLRLAYTGAQLTFINGTGHEVAIRDRICAEGRTCSFAPATGDATIPVASAVFPLTLVAGVPAGLDLDLLAAEALQADLSLSFAPAGAVIASRLPQADGTRVRNVFGAVQAISGTRLVVLNSSGDTVVLTTRANTLYDFPASVCTARNAACLANRPLVEIQASAGGEPGLVADRITFVAPAGAQVARGTITSIEPGLPSKFGMLVHEALPDDGGAAPGRLIEVAIGAGAAYAVGPTGYPLVSGASFESAADLLVGQEIEVRRAGASTVMVYATDRLVLQCSRVSGTVDRLSDDGFVIEGLARFYRDATPAITGFQVRTGVATRSDETAAPQWAAGQRLTVEGPVFNTDAGGPSIAALAIGRR